MIKTLRVISFQSLFQMHSAVKQMAGGRIGSAELQLPTILDSYLQLQRALRAHETSPSSNLPP